MNLLTALRQRVHGMLAIARTTAPADESGSIQRLQLLVRGSGAPAELRDPVRSMQIFGLASSPIPGAHHLVVFLDGDRSKGVAIASEDPRYRPEPAEGETILFNAFGMSIAMSSGGVAINPNGQKVTIDGTLDVTGDIRWNTATSATAASSHEHTNGNNGANTGAPVAGS